MPTPHGPLRVRWAYADDDGGSFELEVAGPPGTQGVVAAPDLGPEWRLASVRLDGAPVYHQDSETPPGRGGRRSGPLQCR